MLKYNAIFHKLPFVFRKRLREPAYSSLSVLAFQRFTVISILDEPTLDIYLTLIRYDSLACCIES